MSLEELRYYTRGHASTIGRYVLQEVVTGLLGWIPSLPGIGLRGLAYRSMIQMRGFSAIESGVRITYAENLRLGRGVYVDRGAYLHACPGGIDIGDGAFIMHNAELHVFNFRDLQHAFIRIGERAFIGESVIIRGQGGVDIGKAVLIGPGAKILAINHQHGDPFKPILDQGISCKGIKIDDGAWIGAGAIILDGVRIGQNAVIGAGAVVTKDVPAHSVAVGMPARVVERANGTVPPPPIAARVNGNGRPERNGHAVPARVGRL